MKTNAEENYFSAQNTLYDIFNNIIYIHTNTHICTVAMC